MSNAVRVATTLRYGTHLNKNSYLFTVPNVTLPNGTTLEYVIDGRNRRIGKKVNGTLAHGFLYEDTLRIVAELDGAGNIVSRFVYIDRSKSEVYFWDLG